MVRPQTIGLKLRKDTKPGRGRCPFVIAGFFATPTRGNALQGRRIRVVCYSATMRPGRTRTTSFSLDEVTLKNLKALAARRHKGNVSAMLAEFAEREAKFLAAERLFKKYRIPPLDDEAAERIEAEWRGEGPHKRTRRRAA
jgi:hypothetical protein